ncbi:Bifunctional epoxide hydrolase 2 [Linderina pennispora]|nr:Bifunctional epoxide hydrolase 2 [Linderina pennispora]
MYTSVFSESVPTDKRSITDARGAQRSEMLAESELGYHISEYQRHGMEGPLNYYRVHELNWQEENSAGFKLDRIHKPCLMVTAGKDKALPAAWTKDMDKYIPNLMRVHIEDSGHWIMIEQKELANKALGEFLATLDHTSAKL